MMTINQIMQQAIIDHKEGRLKEAEDNYRKVIDLKPDYAYAYNNLSRIMYNFAKFEEAEKNATKAIALRPKFDEAYINLGAAQFKLNHLNEAEESYKKLIGFNSKSAQAYFNLSIVLRDQGKYEEAEANYRKSIKLKPDYIKNKKELGLLLNELSRLDKIISSNVNINKGIIDRNKNLDLSNQSFLSPSPIEHKDFYRQGMGTENVGSFLRALVQMVRPNKILEIGAGYTTPFLLEAIINNERIFNDGNLKESYFKDYVYSPKLVLIDDMSLGELNKMRGMTKLTESKYVDFIEGKFQDKVDLLSKEYGNFDFVWFDCGGPLEYEIFIEKYWDLCSGYILFHNTYNEDKPNTNHDTILKKITAETAIFDIVEPHKKRQGSITMINKFLTKIKNKNS